MKEYTVGQRIKVEFKNDCHNTNAVGIGTIVRFEGDYWRVELPLDTRKKIEKKLCGMSDCMCRKITKAMAIESEKEVLLTY
ncbi:MAG: hypothetical protein VB076_05030 [Synergistaceae bacterium]|nr:hypothetical protein [Synergistaceae bacterium]